MGTRGAYGLHYKGQDKIVYNHSDSYPGGLGEDILKFASLHKDNSGELEAFFERILLVNDKLKPTLEQKEELKEFTDLGVGSGSDDDWYNLTRNLQGDLKSLFAMKQAYMIDNKEFLEDSLFCEWGYVINLDSRKLEIYRGFQKKKPKKN